MIVALFDSDGTLYSKQQGRGMLKYLEAQGEPGQARRYLAFYGLLKLLNRAGILGAERFQRLTTVRLSSLVKGLSVSAADEMFEWVAKEFLLPSQRPEVGRRLKEHQRRGHQVVIISAMFVPCLKHVAGQFEVNDYIGMELETRDGFHTGRIVPPLISGQAKAEAARRFFSNRGIDVDWSDSHSYGDSFPDRFMLDLVGRPVVVFPDQKLH